MTSMCPYGEQLSDEWAMVAFTNTPAEDRASKKRMLHIEDCADCREYYEDNILSRIYHKQLERVTA